MSCRALSQPLFVEALVTVTGTGAGFWIGSRRRSIGRLLRRCRLRSTRFEAGGPGYPPFASTQPPACQKTPKNLNCKKLSATIVCDNQKTRAIVPVVVGSRDRRPG
jgi:hypothetical protein